jgi:hypothetical protein
MSQLNQPPKEINIELNNEIAKGTYSNLAIITHSSSEFILDFARMLPGTPKAEVVSRIIMTSEHAKRLFMALKDNISKFEDMNGEIVIHNAPKETIPMGFSSGNANA